MDLALREQPQGPPQGLVLVGANDSMGCCSASWQPPSQENRALSPPGHHFQGQAACLPHSSAGVLLAFLQKAPFLGSVGRDKGGQCGADVPNDLAPTLSLTVAYEKSLEVSPRYLKGTL